MTLSTRAVDYNGIGQSRGGSRGHDRQRPWFPCNFLSNKNRSDMELGMFVQSNISCTSQKLVLIAGPFLV